MQKSPAQATRNTRLGDTLQRCNRDGKGICEEGVHEAGRTLKVSKKCMEIVVRLTGAGSGSFPQVVVFVTNVVVRNQ